MATPTTTRLSVTTDRGRTISVSIVQHWQQVTDKLGMDLIPGRRQMMFEGRELRLSDGVFTLPDGDAFDQPAG